MTADSKRHTTATQRRGEVRIDLSALAANVDLLTHGRGDLDVIAVVKANAYGHGAVPCAIAALDAGAVALGVATVEEAVELRHAQIDARILLLSEPPIDQIRTALDADVEIAAYSIPRLDDFAAASELTGRPAKLHAHIDTGMHRVGMRPDDLVDWLGQARRLGIQVPGAMTHFAVADEPGRSLTSEQHRDFISALRQASVAFPDWRPTVHTGNSAARLRHTDLIAGDDMVRCGIAVYGIEPAPGITSFTGDGRELRPVMSIHTNVSWTSQRQAGDRISYGQRYGMPTAGRVVTLPVGYGDGLPREVGPTGQVLIGGRRFPYAGSITMDQCMIDVGDEDIDIGEPVVLLGSQGQDRITVTDWARWLGTIAYEPVTRLSSRLPRRYLPAEADPTR
ncbi:MAG: alanine racemase [Actinobacteria bacterium]|nr:alanine racemase [Actinomycetota bacterium]MCB9389832.1 alanine racemase [Acidimicrobiia bacterium]